MRFMQTELVLQTKNRSGPAKNRFFCSPDLDCTLDATLQSNSRRFLFVRLFLNTTYRMLLIITMQEIDIG